MLVVAVELVTEPMADGGLFIGDYQAIASDSQAFYPFFAMTNGSVTNKTDIFASAFRSIVAPTKVAPAKGFEARAVPAFVPTAEVKERLQKRILRTLQWRLIGTEDVRPSRSEGR